MTIGDIANRLAARADREIFCYMPNPQTMESNRRKALYSAAALGGLYIIPGNSMILSMALMGYGGLKAYQAIRDWAGK